jgi:hypothetical protein
VEYLNVETLTVGDEVGVIEPQNWGPSSGSVLTVSKRTATQVVLSDDSRWNTHGHEIGGRTYHRRYLITPADARERLAAAQTDRERRNRINELCDTRWSDYPDETMDQVLALLKQAKEASS